MQGLSLDSYKYVYFSVLNYEIYTEPVFKYKHL